MGDQWSAGSLGETDGAVVPGTVTEGLPVNQALSIDAVFRNGVGLLREQPVMALAGGGLLLVMALVIGGLNTGIQLAIAPMVQDAGQYGQILAQFVNIGVSMAQAPIQLLITAGMMVAFGRYVGTDEVRMGDLFSSIAPAVKVLVFGLAMTIFSLLVLSPALGAIAGVFAAPDYMLPLAGVASLFMIVGLVVLIYVQLGLVLVPYAIAIDGLSIGDAVRLSWQWMDGGRLTVFVTNFVIGILGVIASFAMYCFCIGFVLQPAVVAIQTAGFASGWVLMSRSRDQIRSMPFFQRNTPGF